MANIAKDRKRSSKVRLKEEQRQDQWPIQETSMTSISLSGSVQPGWTANRTADEIRRKIDEALAQAFSRDTRFGEHLACPKESWVWELRLTPY